MRRSYTDKQLIDAVATSTTRSGILAKLGLNPGGGNYNILNVHIARLGLSTDHILGRSNPRPLEKRGGHKKPYLEILIRNSSYSNTVALKKRLIADGLLIQQCYECCLTEWRDKQITLHLDHINGDRQDNRFENLRLLCPNCHSQTPTYCRGERDRI